MRARTACVVVLVGCATSRSTGTKPESMTASEHMARAREHSEAAGTDPRTYTSSSYPWYYYWDPKSDHRAIAEAHRDAADQLRLTYEAACVAVPRDSAATSPLDRYTRSIDPMPKGVVFHLAPEAGTPDAVLASLRCHRAWLMLGSSSTADSPLLLDGIVLVVHAGAAGIEVMVGVDNAAQLPELTRRARLTVEHAVARSAQPPI